MSITPDHAKRCASCGILIFPEGAYSIGIDHIVIMRFADAGDGTKKNFRIDYCAECFKNNAAPKDIEDLGLNAKIEPRASNDATEYENAPTTAPLRHSIEWYCPGCRNQLNTPQRAVISRTARFHCPACGKQQFNVCYRKGDL